MTDKPKLARCCGEFLSNSLGWIVRIANAPTGGALVSFGSMDDSIEDMRFCPWCGKRFEVAP